MVKIVRALCDYCGEPISEWVHKKGYSMDNLDFCSKECELKCQKH